MAGSPVLAPEPHLATPVGGLERTSATAEVISVRGTAFARALRVRIGKAASDTNATQLTIRTAKPVGRGDAMLAIAFVRGSSAKPGAPARVMVLFERSEDPWTKSLSEVVSTHADASVWRKVVLPFIAAESYAPGEAMLSVRLAFGPQTVDIGGLQVFSYGQRYRFEDLVQAAADASPLGLVSVTVDRKRALQTFRGFGGNFCQPRYGSSEPMDAVGRYILAHLGVRHARVGLPLNRWAPEPAAYREEGPARAALEAMRLLARRGVPLTVSVWEGPGWMLGGRPEQMGRRLPSERIDDCIEAIGHFLKAAKERYNAEAEHFSFNEPDYGVNFRFTPAEMGEFIRRAGPRFRALGLRTKFLVGDTANGASCVDYCEPLLRDRSIATYLGPIAFHCWDALSAPDEVYERIAALGRAHGKPVWCMEAGHDAQLWQNRDPWRSWENALRTAQAYVRTLRLTGAERMDYWTYQDNYPLVSRDGATPYPVFHVLRQLEEALPPGTRVVRCASPREELLALAEVGPAAGQVAVILVNSAGPGRVRLSGLPPAALARLVISGPLSQRRAASPRRVDPSGRLTVETPSRSVVSVVCVRPGLRSRPASSAVGQRAAPAR